MLIIRAITRQIRAIVKWIWCYKRKYNDRKRGQLWSWEIRIRNLEIAAFIRTWLAWFWCYRIVLTLRLGTQKLSAWFSEQTIAWY